MITEGPFAAMEAAYQMPDAAQRAMAWLHILSEPVQVKIDTMCRKRAHFPGTMVNF